MSTQAQTRPNPPVYRDMDQQALDDAYDQSKWASNQELITGRRKGASARALTRIAPPTRHSYGATAIEAFDLYSPPAQPAPVAVFLHGGAWRRGSAADFAYQAEMFVNAGAHHAVLDFANIDDLNGDLAAMVVQVRRAVAAIWTNAGRLGIDRNRIYLIGHSSGAHLGGCVATTDWARFGVPQDVVKGALLCSGMYELEPVRRSKRSQYVNFTDAVVAELSAIRHLDRLACPLVLACGTNESPEFMRQTHDFAAAVRAAGKPVEIMIAENYNHFEIGETLANPYGLLGHAALAMMGLS
jgi:arylformamidase